MFRDCTLYFKGVLNPEKVKSLCRRTASKIHPEKPAIMGRNENRPETDQTDAAEAYVRAHSKSVLKTDFARVFAARDHVQKLSQRAKGSRENNTFIYLLVLPK